MRLDQVLTKEEFDALLQLFSNDRDEAGTVYEEVRRNLVRFFEKRDCRDPDILADETLFRVASKAHTFDPSRHTRPSSFVFGFASKILLEYGRDPGKMRITYDRWVQATSPATNDPYSEVPNDDLDCLNKCLRGLPTDDRELLIAYYSKEKQEKISMRKAMAEELGIKPEALHMRVHRLRESLKKCLKRCQDDGLRQK